MVSSAHQKADNLEAAILAKDAEKRVRGGESAHEALQHEAHTLRNLETKHGHLRSAHYRHELRLVERNLHRKLEHDGLLPHVHIRHDKTENLTGPHRHPLNAHKGKPIHRTVAEPTDTGQPHSPRVENQTGPSERGRVRRPAQVGAQPEGDPTVGPPSRAVRPEVPLPPPREPGSEMSLPPPREPRRDVPLATPGLAPKFEASDNNPGEPGRIPNWMQIHNGLASKAHSTAPDLAFYGDSITEGMHLNGSFANGFGGTAENFGIHSDTTDNLRYRLEHGEMKFKDGHQPKNVVMLIGTNDIDRTQKSSAQIAHDIIADAELAAKNLPGSKVLLLGLLPRAGSMAEIKDINNRLQSYMNGPHSANLRYADIGPSMLENGKMIRGPVLTRVSNQVWQHDGEHPTYGPGYTRMFNAIKGVLRDSNNV